MHVLYDNVSSKFQIVFVHICASMHMCMCVPSKSAFSGPPTRDGPCMYCVDCIYVMNSIHRM